MLVCMFACACELVVHPLIFRAGSTGSENRTADTVIDIFNATSGVWMCATNLSEARSLVGAASPGFALLYGGYTQARQPSQVVDIFGRGCVSHAECDDGVWCNGQEACKHANATANTTFGICIGGMPPCGLWDPCNSTCQEQTNTCLAPAGTPCSRGNLCDSAWQCDGQGTCGGPEPCTHECLNVCDSEKDMCVPNEGLTCGWAGTGACTGTRFV